MTPSYVIGVYDFQNCLWKPAVYINHRKKNTHLLRDNYHKALVCEESKNQSNNNYAHTIDNNKMLNIEQLCNHINSNVQLPQLIKSNNSKKYTGQMSFYIKINIQPSDYFLKCQIILGIHQNVLILLEKSRIIHWDDQIYQISN